MSYIVETQNFSEPAPEVSALVRLTGRFGL